MLDRTTRVSSSPAAARPRPCASTRKGSPHSSRKTIAGNCVVKCTHMPSRVPGSRQDAAICRRTYAAPRCGKGSGSCPSGWSLRKSSSRTRTTTPAAALPAKAAVQPSPCSRRAITRVETRLPAMPARPASWATSGPRRAGNQRLPRRRTLMNVIASPQPSSAREARAAPYEEEKAKPSLPGREQQDAEGQHPLGAEPVDEEPDRYLHARVDEELEDGEGGQGGGAHVEAVGGVQSGHTEGGAEDDGDEVDRDADAPDGDGAPAAGRIAGERGRGAHRTSPWARSENQLTCAWMRPTTASASPERSASRICSCSVRVLVIRSGWACITATPILNWRSRSWS